MSAIGREDGESMKNLSNLSPVAGSTKKKKRLGRGHGSGLGKTSGKGHKGQKARAGGTVAAGFEGGQTPLYRRLPKRGFNSRKPATSVVDISALERFDEGSNIDLSVLKNAGIVRNSTKYVKILANGELKKSIIVTGIKMSESARKAILSAGGSVKESEVG